MSPLFDHPPAVTLIVAAGLAVPLLFVVLTASVMALWSAAAPSAARQRHTRRLLRDLTELARVLRSRR